MKSKLLKTTIIAGTALAFAPAAIDWKDGSISTSAAQAQTGVDAGAEVGAGADVGVGTGADDGGVDAGADAGADVSAGAGASAGTTDETTGSVGAEGSTGTGGDAQLAAEYLIEDTGSAGVSADMAAELLARYRASLESDDVEAAAGFLAEATAGAEVDVETVREINTRLGLAVDAETETQVAALASSQ